MQRLRRELGALELNLIDYWTADSTGQYLVGWERLANRVGALLLFGVSGANFWQGDDLARFIGKRCRFAEDTFVATDEGAVPICAVDVGDHMVAWGGVAASRIV
jgi:hypothetical protein